MAAGEREIARWPALLPLLVVALVVRAYWVVFHATGRGLDPEWAQASVQILLWVVPCIVLTMILDGVSIGDALRHLGLARGFWTGCAFGIVATAPLGAMVVIGSMQWPDVPSIAAGAVLGPLAASVLFVGFLFTRLVVRARWRLLPALALSALAFGLAHSPSVGQSVHTTLTGDVAAISAGGLLFTWIFHRWNSLWPAMALHGAINFWWIVAGEGDVLAGFIDPAVMPLAAAHAASIVLAIVGTVYWTRRHAPYGLTRIV